MKSPLSPKAIRKLHENISAFREERFQAGYSSALGMIERGEISADKLEKIHDFIEYGPGFEEMRASGLNECLALDGDGIFSRDTAYGASVAISDAWEQVLRTPHDD